MYSLTDFPTEILLAIFSEVDYFTLNLRIRAVCRRFQYILSDTKSGQLADQHWQLATTGAAVTQGKKGQSGANDAITNSQSENEGASSSNEADESEKPSKTYHARLHPCFTLLKVPHKRIIELDAVLAPEEVGFVHSSTTTDNVIRNKFIRFTATYVANEQAIKVLREVEEKEDSIDEDGPETPILMCPACLLPYLQALTVAEMIEAMMRLSYPEHTAKYMKMHHGDDEYISLVDSRLSVILCTSERRIWSIWHPPSQALAEKISQR